MVFEHSLWWLLPAILISSAAAFFKYKKLTGLPDIPQGVAVLLSTLRFLILLFLSGLILNPALSLLKRTKEKPVLVLAQDNSESLLKNRDSLYYNGEYRESLEKIAAKLGEQFEVVRLTFGNRVQRNGKIDFSEKRTDIAAVTDYVRQNFISRPPQAMVLLTDGIYNAGINPRYRLPSFPVYTVALGDTICYPDVFIRTLETDKFNFVGTVFPVKAEIGALKQKGKQLKCILKENGKVIAEKKLSITQDNFLEEVVFEVEAKQKGIAHYTVRVETDSEERTLENNSSETWVNLIDHSARVAIFTHSPHPDIAAVVNAVNVSGIYHCTVHQWEERPDTLKANLIILHNPEPGRPVYEKLIKEAERRRLSLWYILTTRESIGNMARYSKDYSVDFHTDMNEYAQVAFHSEFPFFEFTEEEIAGFADYPPLMVPFWEIHTGSGRTLFRQKIKNTPTSNGVTGFYNRNDSRICYFWGEGLWKWRLYSYRENGNHELFNTLINKIVGYLAVQKGNERFIHDFKPVYEEREEVIVYSELYNDSYELVNTPEVKLNLKYEDKEFTYSFSRYGDKYKINLGNLLSGEYHYHLQTHLKGKSFESKGTFYVRSNNPEGNDVVANPQLLKDLAGATGGQTYEKTAWNELVNDLKQNKTLKPVFRNEIKYIELDKLEILGFILLLLICTEWFLLKYFAG